MATTNTDGNGNGHLTLGYAMGQQIFTDLYGIRVTVATRSRIGEVTDNLLFHGGILVATLCAATYSTYKYRQKEALLRYHHSLFPYD